MPHLSQIIAVEKETKDKAASSINRARGVLGSKGLLSGLARSYTPKDDEGEQLPPESTRVQYTVKRVLTEITEDLTTLFDTIATKDAANCLAKADVIVDGQVKLSQVPATTLLFLQKQLAELLSFVKAIPTLDSAEQWHYNEAQDCYATPPVESVRTKKELKVLVLAPATKEHAQQAQAYQEDISVGRWKTIKYSGAIPVGEHNAMLARIERLQKAVTYAKEEANRQEAKQQHIGEAVLRYIFG